jgi:HTH-type transcriptional regulator / antitoxin HigA
MHPKVIKNNEDHKAALAHLDTLLDAKPGSPEFEELEVWECLIEAYEERKCPIGMPDPISAIRFRMEQQGLKNKDLVPHMGSKSRVSEVLNGKRPLTLAMIQRLHEGLGIPAAVLLQKSGVQCAA